MKLNLNNKESILFYARKYDKTVNKNDRIEDELLKWFNENRFLNRDNFLKLCLWKSKRPKKYYLDKINSDERIKQITQFALKTDDEYLRLEMLTLLKGVSHRVASVILHFSFPNKYMIMDFRAIWSLGWKQPKSYSLEFWLKYTNEGKKIANKNGVTLRELDKALWQNSKENRK